MEAKDREVGERWETNARSYDSVYDSPGRRGRIARERLAVALRLLGDRPGRVLDVGMGTGRLCEELERRGWTVYGVDRSQAMVELARARLPGASERLLRARAEELPFPEESFDAVTALGVLEYSADLGAAVGELARVLAPAGLAVVGWPNFHGLYPLWRRRLLYPAARAVKRIAPFGRAAPPATLHALGRRQFEAVLIEASLRPQVVEYVGPRGRSCGGTLGPALAAQLVFAARKEEG